MNSHANLTTSGRDIRLHLFLGIANWFIFLDHIPDNVVSWITARNYGFSGGSDVFIFISGYTASMIYAKMMLERGFIVAATRIWHRAWQLYVAYIVLFVIYAVSIGYVATQYSAPDIFNEFNIVGLIDHPVRTLAHGLALQSRLLNLDMLQLYTLLMASFAPVLWLMLRKPVLTMIGSLALYVAARQYEWNLPSYPDGSWYFNPFCWQLLFLCGAWFALGGARPLRAILKARVATCFAIAYLIFALAMTMAGRFPQFGKLFPVWLFDAFNPNDKTNLAPYRLLHFMIAAFLMTRLVPQDWRGLKWPIFQPVIKCGEQSLAVFCVGVFLSFIGHFELLLSSGSVTAQVLVSASGIAVMSFVAYYTSWSKQQDSWKTLALLE
jgi:hypothetical protein